MGDEEHGGAAEAEVIERCLTEATGERFEVQAVNRAATGHANTTWLVDAAPRPVVVKVQAEPSVVFGRDPAIEPAMLRALRVGGAPVPAVLAEQPGDHVITAPWFVMERVDAVGVPDDAGTGYVVEGWFADATDQERARVWDGFVRALAAIHAVPTSSVLAGPHRGGTTSAVIEYLRAAAEDAAPGRVPREQRLLDLLLERLPVGADEHVAPCMGDARLANALVHDGEVAALVDFEICFVADPAADVGYCINYDAWLAHATGRRLGGIPSPDATWDRWEELTGRTVAPADRRWWEAFGSLVICVTATRAIGMMIADGTLEVPSPEDINPFLAFSEALLDG